MNTRPKLLVAAAIALLAATLGVRAAMFTVTTTADDAAVPPAGSLREAITLANAGAGNVINFNISGSGVQTIALATALPTIANSTTIDGTTQPGYDGANPKPLIVIDGGGTVDANGLTVNTGSSAGPTIRGLCIIRFGLSGGTARHGIEVVLSDGFRVTGCYIGIDAAGTTAKPNTGDGIVHRASFATPAIYGGSTAAERNVISGNLGAGIRLQSSFSNIIGNYIGTSANGLSAVPNGGDGVLVNTTVNATNIGTATAGQGNVISGNTGAGIHAVQKTPVIKGNLIGLAADGATALGNGSHGVLCEGQSATIGDTVAGALNIISSNGGDGVRVNSTSGTATVSGNRIGTDSTGMLARGNGGYGVNFIAATGDASVSSNVISANGSGGVRLVTSAKAGAANNFVGVNANATAKLGNLGNGITVVSGNASAAFQNDFSGNTIGGNTGAGLEFNGANLHDFYVKNNRIGTDSAGTANLGNTGPGIRITGGAMNQTIGSPFLTGTTPSNLIAFNGGDGIEMNSTNFITINSIHDNGGLAIDILPNGPNPPTPNGLLNPAVLDATIGASTVDIDFTHDAKPSTQYTTLFYLNDEGDPSGYGELQTYLGQQTWTTNSSGHFEGSVQFPLPSGAAPFAPAEGPSSKVVSAVSHTGDLSVGAISGGEAGLYSPSTGPVGTITTETNGGKASSANTDHPINTFSGELFELESVGLTLRGPFALFFARYSASKVTSDGQITSALGRNRLHNFDAKLIVESDKVTAVLCNGRVMTFVKVNGLWKLSAPLDLAFQLVETAGTFVLGDPRSQRMWTFDANRRLAQIADGRGNAHTLAYDVDGKLTSVTDGLGRTLTFSYDVDNHLVGVSDGTRSIAFTYSGPDLATASDPLEASDPGHHTTRYTYDASGHLLATERPRGNTPFTQTYMDDRVETQTRHPDAMTNNTTSLAYNTTTHATTIKDAMNKTRVHTHTATGEMTKFTDEADDSITMTSDTSGRRNSVTDRLGRKSTIVYHAASGKPASITAPDGATTTFTYKARVLNGLTFYDLVKITSPDGTTRSFTYDAKGNVLVATDQLGKQTKFTYNERGQVPTITSATGGVARRSYDDTSPIKGNLATTTDSDAGIGTTTYAYDGFSRPTRVTHPDGTHLDIGYDLADRIVSIISERSKTFSFAYDSNGNLISATDAAGEMSQLAYDSLDRVIGITNRLGKSRSRAFDERDQIESVTDATNRTTTFTHDERRRLTGLTDSGGKTVLFGRDDETRNSATTSAGGSQPWPMPRERRPSRAMRSAM